MKTKHLITLLLLAFQILPIFAQMPMVAYRKDGIWSYFDTNGKLMWTPYLDIASLPRGWVGGKLCASGLEVVSEKIGDIGLVRAEVLYDEKGKIVYRPKLTQPYRFKTGLDAAGFALLEYIENGHIVLCDKDGNLVYEAPNITAMYLGAGVMAFLKTEEELEGEGNRNYQLFDIRTKKVFASIACDYFEGNLNNGAIICRDSKGKYGIMGKNGKLLQPMEWEMGYMENLEENLFERDFVYLQNQTTKKWSLFNQAGKIVVSDFEDSPTLHKYFFRCETTEGTQFFSLQNGNATALDKKYTRTSDPNSNGSVIAEDDSEMLTFLDNRGQKVAQINKAGEQIYAVETHFWIQDAKGEKFDCYTEKGKKVGTIAADMVSKGAYGHATFQKDNKWGLASETGRVIVKPTLELGDGSIPEVSKGYWEISTRLSDNSVRFDFYNFEGKLVLSTTSEKDGWDYIVPQEHFPLYFSAY